MIAELEDPEEADVIAESIAGELMDSTDACNRIAAFSGQEKRAINEFLKYCGERYGGDSPLKQMFVRAAARVQGMK